jgi:hypothetical protein
MLLVSIQNGHTCSIATDVLDQVLIHDKNNGRYSFDYMGPPRPVELFAIFLGYATAQLLPETKEEQQARIAEEQAISVLPEV